MDLSKLNKQQRDAVLAPEGPLLIFAGAGTGKTTVITYRIAHLIENGLAAHKILGLTFTNKAAKEMAERVRALTETNGKKKQPTLCTFHAFGARVLREHIKDLGYKPKFTIYDTADQLALMRTVMQGVDCAAEISPRSALSRVSLAKNTGVEPAPEDESVGALLYDRYQEGLKARNAVDFDDLVLLPVRLFETNASVRSRYRNMYSCVLVDEYQDTNIVQYQLLRLLVGKRLNVCAVGDDDQSIYGWRGADYRNILKFSRDFPGTRTIVLKRNYRSTQVILDAAGAVIACNPERKKKSLKGSSSKKDPVRIMSTEDEIHEAKKIASDLQWRIRQTNARWDACAVLFRTNAQARHLEQEMRQRNIPYTLVGATSFFDRREIRDLAAYLKAIVNPYDEISLLRIVNFPQRGIGPGTISRLIKFSTDVKKPVGRILKDAAAAGVAPREQAGVDSFAALLESFRRKASRVKPSELLSTVVERTNYKKAIEFLYPSPREAEVRWTMVEEFVQAAAAYEKMTPKPSLRGFLETVSLDNKTDETDTDEPAVDQVSLMTVHSAKGLEWDHVYVAGMEEGLFPHRKSAGEDGDTIDEERRLFYVAVTRARHTLTVSYARSRNRHGHVMEAEPSRFLTEVPAKLAEFSETSEDDQASPEVAKAYIAEMKKMLGARTP
ncbi:ATP-dependent helicase [Planctomycetota bacterium]